MYHHCLSTAMKTMTTKMMMLLRLTSKTAAPAATMMIMAQTMSFEIDVERYREGEIKMMTTTTNLLILPLAYACRI
jgi:hypothetical protein